MRIQRNLCLPSREKYRTQLCDTRWIMHKCTQVCASRECIAFVGCSYRYLFVTLTFTITLLPFSYLRFFPSLFLFLYRSFSLFLYAAIGNRQRGFMPSKRPTNKSADESGTNSGSINALPIDFYILVLFPSMICRLLLFLTL